MNGGMLGGSSADYITILILHTPWRRMGFDGRSNIFENASQEAPGRPCVLNKCCSSFLFPSTLNSQSNPEEVTDRRQFVLKLR